VILNLSNYVLSYETAINRDIGLYYTLESVSKIENRFRITHPQGDLRV